MTEVSQTGLFIMCMCICAFICMVIPGIWFTIQYADTKKTTTICSIILSFFGLFFLTFAVLGGVQQVYVERKSYDIYICDIVSLERNTQTEGSFFLGTGYISDSEQYFYYKITDNGYKLDHVKCEYTYIVETDEITPSLYHFKESTDRKSYYRIYCPVGTIIKTYTA